MDTECVQRFDLISHCVTIDAQGSLKGKQKYYGLTLSSKCLAKAGF